MAASVPECTDLAGTGKALWGEGSGVGKDGGGGGGVIKRGRGGEGEDKGEGGEGCLYELDHFGLTLQ